MNSNFSVFDQGSDCTSCGAGTSPAPEAHPPKPGRYALVGEGATTYLYIPEVQELFAAPAAVIDALRQADIEAPRLTSLRAAASEGEAAAGERVATLEGARSVVSQIARAHGNAQPLPVYSKDSDKDGLKDLVIHIAQICNLACVYCYAENLNKAKKSMTLEVADAVVDRALLLAPKGLHSIKFLGGEPTIAWDVAVYLMDRFNAIADQRGLERPLYVTVTNGTLLTDAIVQDMITYRMYAMVSLDGASAIHDRNRPYIGGRGSHHKVIDAIRRMLAAGLRPAIEAVYTREHLLNGVSICELLHYFQDLGIREAQVTIALGVWHELDTIGRVAEVVDDFAKAAQWSVRSYSTDDPFLLRGVQFVLTGFATKTRREYVCGAGRTFMAVNHDGKAFPCYLMESDDTFYGFVDSRWDEDRFIGISNLLKRNGKSHHPVCSDCWANEICQSCLGSTFLIDAKIAKPPAWFCGLQKQVIAAALAEIGAARQSENWSRFLRNVERMTAGSVAD
jgi:uncharacterized protein